MKKILMLIVGVLITLGVCSCSKCSRQNEAVLGIDTTVVTELNVENIISMDRQDMYLNHVDGDSTLVKWFETCVLLEDFLDADCEPVVAGISNVFQTVDIEEGGADTHVILYSHTRDTSTVEVKHAFWIEDMPMNDEPIAVTFKEAVEKVMEVNLPKPHSKHVVLRKEVGIKDCNPQWIFGNSDEQIYVDAVTGNVSDKNPAFGE